MKFFVEPRRWWGARLPPRGLNILQKPVSYVFFTYTKGQYVYTSEVVERELMSLQFNHINRGASDIVYNFLISPNGHIYEGRGWKDSPKLGSQWLRISTKSISIAYMGIFKHTKPPMKMIRAGDWLVKHGVLRGLIAPRFEEVHIAGCGSIDIEKSTKIAKPL